MAVIRTMVVNLRNTRYDVYIGRPGKYENPFIIGRDGTRDEVCDKHDLWLDGKIEAPNGRKPPTLSEITKDLKGKRLGCFCSPLRCHGDNYVKRIKKQDISPAGGVGK